MESLINAEGSKAPGTVTATTVQTPQGPLMTDAPFPSFDLDALIPAEMREAAQKDGLAPATEVKADPNATQAPKSDEVPKGEEGKEAPPADTAVVDEVDKIVNEIIPPETPSEESQDTAPFWQDNPHYKELVTYLNYNGTPTALLQKFAQDLVDKSTIDNGQLVTGLETKNKELEDRAAQYENEIMRLREVEREAIFETLPDTEENFVKPMQDAATAIKNILDLEGEGLPLSKVLLAKTKPEVSALLKNTNLDQDQENSLLSQWRVYQETKRGLDEARSQAKASLKDKLSLNVKKETISSVFKKGLVDSMTGDERFKYIQTGINEGLSKHENVARVLHLAQNNFQALMDAITEPHAIVRNTNEMKKLAMFALRTAHNDYHATQLPEVQKKLANAEEKLTKIAKAYSDLKKSATGKVGAQGLPTVGRSEVLKNGKPVEKTEEDSEIFKKFLNKEISLEELLK